MYFLLSGMSDSIWRHDQLVPKPVIGRSLILWHTDDGVLTDRTALMHIPEHNGRDWQFSELATGMVGYRSERVGLLPWTGFRDHRAEDGGTRQLLKAVHEQVGELRYVWAFLATINEIPVTRSEVRQSKGFVARGAYRKFMDHTIIRLTVPHERFRALARKIIAHARRRAHQVRGHWRKDWHYPGSESCAHEWMLSDVDHKYCRLCPRREIFVHEHQRGDSSLGFVTADYQVHHE